MSETPETSPRRIGLWLKVPALAAACVGLMLLGLAFADTPSKVSLFWPTNAVVLAVLVKAPKRHWPAYLAAFVAAYMAVVGSHSGYLFVFSIPLAACNGIGIVLGALLLSRLSPAPFSPLGVKSAARFTLACAVIPPAVSAVAAAATISFFVPESDFLRSWLRWTVSDAVAVLLITPPILAWINRNHRKRPTRPSEVATGFVLSLAAALVVFVLPGKGGGVFMPYLAFPLIILAAFRLPVHWALTVWPVFCLTGIVCEILVPGPFEAVKGLANAVSMQGLFGLGSFTLLMVLGVHEERTRAREGLARSEELHRHILESINDAVLLCDDQGSLTYVCPNVKVIFGYSVEEVRAKGDVSGLLGPGLYDPAELEKKRLIENVEREVRDSRGRTKFLLVTVKRVDILEGAILVSCRDITRRKLTENALKRSLAHLEDRIRTRTSELENANRELNEVVRELEREIGERARVERALRSSESMLTRAQRIARIGCWEREFETDRGYWSEEYYRILGHEPGETDPSIHTFLDCVHPDERQEIESFIRAAVFDKRSYSFDCRVVLPDGGIRHLHSQAELVERDGKVVGYGTLQDITERKQTEIALNETREMLLSVLDQMPAGVMLVDAKEQRINLVNRVAAEIAHMDEQELALISPTTLPPWKTFKPDGSPWTDPATHPLPAAILKGEVSRDVEMVVEYPDERRSWLLVNGAPVRDDKGEIVAGVLVYQDISARKAMENQIIEARLAAEDASKAKSEFLANMSHEIRTPISGIIGMADMALARRPNPEQREYLSTIKQTTDSLLRIVNDILDFSKIEARRMTFDSVPFSPEDLVRDAIKPLEIQAGTKGLVLRIEIEPGLPRTVSGDPDRLAQVLRNLAGNAVKFTDTGRVVVRVGTQGIEKETVRLYFEVQDTGPGIDKADLPYLFEAFSQADASFTKRFQGTGLGLAISKRLAEIMGGGLMVCSEPGQGSLFRFTALFKAASPEAEQTLAADKGSNHLATPLSILLAEDNAVNRTFIEFFLAEAGHTVTTVEDGSQALEAVAQKAFDAVIMDVQMPSMDGDEAARRIRDGRAEALDPDVPIVALTAYAMKGDKERFLKAGMDEYLSKPVDPDAIIPALARALKNKGRL